MQLIWGFFLLFLIVMLVIYWHYIITFLLFLASIVFLICCGELAKAKRELKVEKIRFNERRIQAEEQETKETERLREWQAQQSTEQKRKEEQYKEEERTREEQNRSNHRSHEKSNQQARQSKEYNEGKKATAVASSCYNILSVPVDCTKEEAHKAYREMANAYHPDKVSHLAPEFVALAEDRMKAI